MGSRVVNLDITADDLSREFVDYVVVRGGFISMRLAAEGTGLVLGRCLDGQRIAIPPDHFTHRSLDGPAGAD